MRGWCLVVPVGLVAFAPAQLDQRLIYLMIAAMIVYSLSQAMCEWVVAQPAGGIGPRSAR